jgi:hypothetical protein
VLLESTLAFDFLVDRHFNMNHIVDPGNPGNPGTKQEVDKEKLV